MNYQITIDTSQIRKDLFKFEELASLENIPKHLFNLFFSNLHRIISINFSITPTTDSSAELAGRAYFTVSLKSCAAALRAGNSDFIRHMDSLNKS